MLFLSGHPCLMHARMPDTVRTVSSRARPRVSRPATRRVASLVWLANAIALYGIYFSSPAAARDASRPSDSPPVLKKCVVSGSAAVEPDAPRRQVAAKPDIGASDATLSGSIRPVTPVTIHHLYVATTGSDANPGGEATPFRTIQRAASVAKPSTTVHVASGIYSENVVTKTNGNATGRIYYVSDIKWGAKIFGSGTEGTWTNFGNFTDIVGFDISGSGRLGILNWASHTNMGGNHVHHIAVSGGCTGNGGAGIMNANYSGSDNNTVGNLVHDIGVPGACNGVHGIYHSNLRGRISDNIVYRASSYGIHLWHAANKVTIANNTVFENGSASMGGGIVMGSGDSPGGVILDNTKVINNIVYSNPAASIKEYCYSGQRCVGSRNIIANNLVYGNGNGILLQVGTASGTIAADPEFVNYQPNGEGNYRLKRTSPARRGTSILVWNERVGRRAQACSTP